MFFGAAGVYDGIHLCTGSVHTRGLTGSWASTSTILAILGQGVVCAAWRPRASAATRSASASTGAHGRPGGAPWCWRRHWTASCSATRPFWNNGDEPIHFTVFDHPPTGVVRHAAQLLFGGKRRDLPDPPFHSRSAGRVELRLDRPFTIDGEFFRAAPGVPVVITADEEVRYVKLGRDRPGPGRARG